MPIRVCFVAEGRKGGLCLLSLSQFLFFFFFKGVDWPRCTFVKLHQQSRKMSDLLMRNVDDRLQDDGHVKGASGPARSVFARTGIREGLNPHPSITKACNMHFLCPLFYIGSSSKHNAADLKRVFIATQSHSQKISKKSKLRITGHTRDTG